MGKSIQKLLVICGPTATGKTELALQLAKEFNGTLGSADSRQVYKYMDIGTGKGSEKILGYDLVRPDEEFSVSSYSRFASQAIEEIQKEKKLPILVGGTGLYIKAVVDGIGTINIPRILKLRSQLEGKKPEELFEILKKLDPHRTNSMNNSDKNNPRRLIRAIEISNLPAFPAGKQFTKPNYDVLMIGLIAPLPELKKRIENRVEERIKNGFEKEIDLLKEKDLFRYVPRVTLGYKDWPDIGKWKIEEFKYAKRQITWFKKDKRINWFSVGEQKEVENLIKKWYAQADATQD